MESYVIRIYRRHDSEPERVVGLVEHPENGAVERFSGVSELVNILLTPPLNGASKPGEKIHRDTERTDKINATENPVGTLYRYRNQ
ncbi:MAG: hypothetical protein HY274_09410 [Gammaproteobacteria bacterium]|nr:hypothetical protein [Gammaproteobacteria bacterium]